MALPSVSRHRGRQVALHPLSLLSPHPTRGRGRLHAHWTRPATAPPPQATPPRAFLGTNQHRHHQLPQPTPEDALVPSEAMGPASSLPSGHHHRLLPFLEAAAERPCSAVRSGGQDLLGHAGQLFPHPPAGLSRDSSRTQPRSHGRTGDRQRESEPGTSSCVHVGRRSGPLKMPHVKLSLAPFRAGSRRRVSRCDTGAFRPDPPPDPPQIC